VHQSYIFHFVWNCYEKTGNNQGTYIDTPFDFWGPPNRDAENLVVTTPTACMVRDNQLFINMHINVYTSTITLSFKHILLYAQPHTYYRKNAAIRTNKYLTHPITSAIDAIQTLSPSPFTCRMGQKNLISTTSTTGQSGTIVRADVYDYSPAYALLQSSSSSTFN
jgi:hypothetical protein